MFPHWWDMSEFSNICPVRAIAGAKVDAGWMSVPSYAVLGLEPQGSAPLPVTSLIFVS